MYNRKKQKKTEARNASVSQACLPQSSPTPTPHAHCGCSCHSGLSQKATSWWPFVVPVNSISK